MIKSFAKGCASAIVLSGLTAGMATAQDEITLNIWSDATRLPMFEKYDETHDGVTLNITTVATDDLMAKLLLSLRSKSEVPDAIFMANISFTAQLASRRANYMMDLSGKVPQEILDQYLANSNSVCRVNGKLYCLRNDAAHLHIWYNAPLMEKLGEPIPETWEEYAALGAKLSDQGMVLGTGIQNYPVTNMLTSSGCELAAPVEGKPDTLRINATSPACERGAKLMDEMLANGSLAKLSPFDPAFIQLFQEQKVPLFIAPTWFGEHVIKARYGAEPGTVGAALPLRWSDQEEPVTWGWGGGTYGGWKDTAHPEQVVDLIIWMATALEVQATATTMPAFAPASKAWSQTLKESDIYVDDTIFATELAAAAFSDPDYVSLRFDANSAVLKTLIDNINNDRPVVDALPALQKELVNQARLNGYTVVE